MAKTGPKLTDKYTTTIRGRAVKLYCSAHQRAKKFGSSITIDTAWVEGRLMIGYCKVTGLPFTMEPNKNGRTSPLSPSLDRIDSSKGYTEDNVQVVVWIYNNAKSHWGVGALHALARALVQQIGEKDV